MKLWSFALFAALALLSHPSQANECLKIKAAFDIGSGATKMKVAKVNTCEQRIESVLLEEDEAVAYKQDLAQSSNQAFSAKVMQEGLKALKLLKEKAQKYAPSEYLAVATSAFRKAKNANELVAKISSDLKIDVKIIDQEMEAKLGYYGGVAKAAKKADHVLVWDIGGGSMQMVTRNNKKLAIYGGQVASVTFKNKIIQELQKKDVKKITSPNPIGDKVVNSAIELAKKLALADVPQTIKTKLADTNSEVIGIGGVHYYSVRGQTGKGETYNREQIKKAINEKLSFSDQQIGGKYASTEVSNLILVYGFMDALKVNQVKPVKVNLADGLLLMN